jgi:hypothetical protein
VPSLWTLAAIGGDGRQALDHESTGRAVAICLIGFALNFAVLFAPGKPTGVPVVIAPDARAHGGWRDTS